MVDLCLIKNTNTVVTNAKEMKKDYHTYKRYVKNVEKIYFENQCIMSVVNSKNQVFQCNNYGLHYRNGMCKDCYENMMKRKGLYPHKDNDTRLVEVYLEL